jgi:hypothetical protein
MFSIICFDFRNFKTKEEFSNFCSKMNLSLNVDAYWKLKTGEWNGHEQWRVWIDSNSFNLIAFENKEEQNFSSMFVTNLGEMSVLSPGDLPPVLNTNKAKLDISLDSILDKISSNGINSLTNEEKKFLEAQ